MEVVSVAKEKVISKGTRVVHHLNSVEIEVIHLFFEFARVMGLPRSIAEIFGLIFASEKALAMDTLMNRLNLSKGSASQGLRYLMDRGAIRAVYIVGDRRTHYEAAVPIDKFAAHVMRHQVLPHLENATKRLNRIELDIHQLSEEQRKHVAERTRLLRQWERTSRRILEIMIRVSGGD